METNKIEKVTPRGSQNIVFQYCWDDGIDFYETSRDNVLFWISSKEKEKLFAFECEKKKEFQTQVVYDTPEDDIQNKIK